MKYAIFQTLNGVPTSRMEPGMSGLHDDMREARLRLTQRAGKGWPGTPEDYVIQPVDDRGVPMEKVDDIESEALGAQAAELVRKDKELREIIGVMVASRQLHTVAAQELEYRLEELREKDEIPEKVGEVLYQSAANRAAGEFDNVELFETMPGTTAWLAAVCDRDVQEEAIENKEMMEAAEKDRRNTPIYLPFEPIAGQSAEWNRKRTICFAGVAESVELLLSYLEQCIGSIKNKEAEKEEDKRPWQQILRLALEAEENDFPTIQVPATIWEDCCRKEVALMKVLGTASQFMGTAADVLMVDDLGVAETGIVANMPIMSRANKAHKLLKRTADKYGYCVICGIVIDNDEDLKTPVTEQLAAHTTLRRVNHRIRGDVFDLYLGERLVASSLSLKQYRLEKESIIVLE